jgi:Bacterial Ig-like domain
MFLVYLVYAGAAPARADTGYRDFSYGNGTVNSPTGEKPQSKLWFNDGTWWGLLFDAGTEDWYIYRFDQSTQTWSKTSTLVEPRSSARSDVLWDGSRLYVASAPSNTQSPNQAAQLKRFSYDKASKSYTLDAGFPTSVASNPLEAIVLDKDTTGRLWVTYTQGNQVYVNRSLTSDSSWGTPFVLPVNGTSVDSDDISAVVAFDSKIGVMWSNQTDGTFYFATHNDGDPDNVWQGGVAMQGNKYSDDHINLKSLQADSSGRVFAAVKTSVGDIANSDSNAPLIDLLVLGTNGNWKQPVTFGRVQDDHTRPIVIIDEQNRNLYMFATSSVNGGTIYYKQAGLDNISFAAGKGTPFIESSADTAVNNATSTKQNVNSASGLVVLASDHNSKYYLHNTLNLNGNNADTTAPTAISVTPADAATGVATADNVEVTFSEDVDSSTLTASTFTLLKQGATTPLEAQVSYDSATKKATLDPEADLEAGTTYTATVKGGTSGVKDLAGNPLAQDKTWSFTTAAAQGSQTVNLSSVADGGLTELAPTTNNGTATTLKVDGNDPDPSGGDLYAALGWDLSQIPSGATVSSATVTLNLTNASLQSYGAYELKRVWNEGQLSWNQAATGTPWATAGAKGTTDRGSQIASVTPTNIAPYTFTIPASVVQGWVSAPSSNNGILLANTTNSDGFVFQTKEGANPPKLTINYTTSGGGDTTPPQSTIDSGPSGTVGSTSASFTFSSDEAGSTFECSLDGSPFSACTSPKDYTNLSGGSHTFEVRAIDASGNTDATPASRTWTVNTAPPPDTTPPETTIDSGPTGTVNSTSASFAFSSSESNSTFECSLDGSPFSACTSPESYTNLSYSSHTFEVRATDAAGNVDTTPASRTFSVVLPPPQDTTPPVTTIDSGPSGTIKQNNATFTFSSSEANSTFECSLDNGAFSACSSPKKYTGLANGPHTFSVRAKDAAGNIDPNPPSSTWTVRR